MALNKISYKSYDLNTFNNQTTLDVINVFDKLKNQELNKRFFEYYSSYFNKRFKSKNYRLFVIYSNGVSSGFLEGKIKGNSFMIDLIKIKESFKNKKLGKKLFYHTVAHLRSKDKILHFPVSKSILDNKILDIRENFLKRKNNSKIVKYKSKKRFDISVVKRK